MLLHTHLTSIILLLLAYFKLFQCQNTEDDIEDRIPSFSQLSLKPIPIALHVINNTSSAQVEMQLNQDQVLSNTTLDDFKNDNQTQQLQMQYRNRYVLIIHY